MRNLDIADTRDKLELYAQQPLDEGQLRVEHGILLGALPPGGRDQIIESAAPETDEERAVVFVDGELGHD
jgi:argininosuccinate synthase